MATASSFLGTIDEDLAAQLRQQQQQQQASSIPMAAASLAGSSLQTAAAPVKKKRNQPSIYPDAEVIALSPKSLMATNRFICEVCNKGFQREQNLQLHRRGHNLPWKLKQKSAKDTVQRRVFVCPEPSCPHNDPSRALGDLTGIKKHFSRKHGEKKWKCDKCSKKYAVQSDLKAHSKTCGTREYRCDCGTLFSRRDSFITHRAFCDAVARESARLPTSLTALGRVHHLYNTTTPTIGLGLSRSSTISHLSGDLLSLGQFDHHLLQASNPSPFFLQDAWLHDSKPFHGMMNLPDLHSSAATATNAFSLGFFSTTANSTASVTDQSNNSSEIFSTITNNSTELPAAASLFAGNLYDSSHHHAELIPPQMSATALLQKAAQMGATTSTMEGATVTAREKNLKDLMNSLANGSTAGMGFGFCDMDGGALTRDFLGVGSTVRGTGEGADHIGSLDTRPASPASARSFHAGSL